MYGRYTKDLGEYAKEEAKRLKLLERRRKQEDKAREKVRKFSLWVACFRYFVLNLYTFFFIYKCFLKDHIETFHRKKR